MDATVPSQHVQYEQDPILLTGTGVDGGAGAGIDVGVGVDVPGHAMPTIMATWILQYPHILKYIEPGMLRKEGYSVAVQFLNAMQTDCNVSPLTKVTFTYRLSKIRDFLRCSPNTEETILKKKKKSTLQIENILREMPCLTDYIGECSNLGELLKEVNVHRNTQNKKAWSKRLLKYRLEQIRRHQGIKPQGSGGARGDNNPTSQATSLLTSGTIMEVSGDCLIVDW